MTPAESLAREKKWRAPRSDKVEPKTPLHCRCREIRESLRLSVRDVAKAVHLSVPGLWQIEKGRDVQMTSAMRLAEFYGKRIDEIWSKAEEQS